MIFLLSIIKTLVLCTVSDAVLDIRLLAKFSFILIFVRTRITLGRKPFFNTVSMIVDTSKNYLFIINASNS